MEARSEAGKREGGAKAPPAASVREGGRQGPHQVLLLAQQLVALLRAHLHRQGAVLRGVELALGVQDVVLQLRVRTERTKRADTSGHGRRQQHTSREPVGSDFCFCMHGGRVRGVCVNAQGAA